MICGIYLGGPVHRQQRARDPGRGTSDVDDTPALPVGHARHHQPTHVDHGRDVAPDHVVEQLRSPSRRRGGLSTVSVAGPVFDGLQEVLGVRVRQANVVDQHAHLEPMQLPAHVAVHRGRVRVGEVSADALDAAARVLSTDLFGGRLQFGLRPANQHDVHAAAGQLPGVRLAQPVRGSCHNLNTIARAREHTFYTRVDHTIFI